MPAHNRDERVLVARIAAAERWGRTADRVAATAPARAGLRARFEREADPGGTMLPEDRAIRADALMRAHMARMSLRAAQARRKTRAIKRTALELAVLDAEDEAA
jgi:hypothetical protein